MSDLIDRIAAAICAKRCEPSEPCPAGCPLPHPCRALAEAIVPVAAPVADEGAGAVRALEWVSYGSGVFWGNGLFSYEVWERARGSWWWRRAGNATWYQPENDTSLDAAKAAAQADYAARILSALPEGARVVTAEQISAWADAWGATVAVAEDYSNIGRPEDDNHIAAMWRIAGGDNG